MENVDFFSVEDFKVILIRMTTPDSKINTTETMIITFCVLSGHFEH